MAACLRAVGRGEIVSAADPDAAFRRRARAYLPRECPIHEEPRRVIDDPAVEIVYIATPNHTHADLAVAALDAGKAVFCEKPMATTVADCDRVLEAVQRTGGFFALTMQNRYSFWCERMTELVRDRAIGRPLMMWCHEFRKPFSPSKAGSWIYYSDKSGGPFVEKNSHHWDIFNWWAQSKAVRVHASVRCHGVHAPGDIWDCGWATVEYEDGILANLGLSMLTPKGHNLHMGIIGERGWAESFRTPDGGTVHIHPAHGEAQTLRAELSPEQAALGHAGAELPMLQHLFDCLERGLPPATDGWWGRESVLIGVAAEISARERRVIELDELRRASGFGDTGPLSAGRERDRPGPASPAP